MPREECRSGLAYVLSAPFFHMGREGRSEQGPLTRSVCPSRPLLTHVLLLLPREHERHTFLNGPLLEVSPGAKKDAQEASPSHLRLHAEQIGHTFTPNGLA